MTEIRVDYDSQKSSNPFAIVVMAHLKAKETRRNLGDRQRWKWILAKQLYQTGSGASFYADGGRLWGLGT